jgi:hypothetical protein
MQMLYTSVLLYNCCATNISYGNWHEIWDLRVHDASCEGNGRIIIWSYVVPLLAMWSFSMENAICTSSAQQGYNTPSHESGLHTLGPTSMWGGVVHLKCK